MKRIGIVGGIGWQSTVEYYAGLCRLSEQRQKAERRRERSITPEISIESLDLHTAIALLGRDENTESWRRFDEYHRTALKRLEASDVEVAVIASNTPHHRFSSIMRGVTIPVLSIVEASAKEAMRMGATRVLILGTALTMRSRMYPETFLRYGIEAAPPPRTATRASLIRIIEQIHGGRITGTAERIHRIAKNTLGGRVPVGTVVCLACTELPLAFTAARDDTSFEYHGVRYLNTAAAHIRALFDFAAT